MSKRVDWLSAKARSAYRQLELGRIEKLRSGVPNGGAAGSLPVLSQNDLDISHRDTAIEESTVMELEQLVAQIGATIQQLSAHRIEGQDSSSTSAAIEVESKNLDLLESQMMPIDLVAPFDGVVIEGERRNLLGSSVKRGDKLFRIAQVRDLYVILQVPEHAIRELRDDVQAELLLLSQPGEKIKLKVASFVPMAQVKGEEGNQFLLKAQILDPAAPWWRPGMTGIAKIEVGYRNITWVLFHRMIDKLRLWLWW
jgi:multidrug resistance efflux pump